MGCGLFPGIREDDIIVGHDEDILQDLMVGSYYTLYLRSLKK